MDGAKQIEGLGCICLVPCPLSCGFQYLRFASNGCLTRGRCKLRQVLSQRRKRHCSLIIAIAVAFLIKNSGDWRKVSPGPPTPKEY